ncbi:MFS transporter [Halorussus salinisoli]|uniref:MFS transporter n=1 Tax=Halorussus salinisoli TaxID=2558242 RepID=UPI0010C1BEFA|nr:MFS transporter [Halorussus salinisoli]
MSDSTPAGLRYAPYLVAASVGWVTFGYAAVPSLIVARFDADLVSVGLLMSAILFAYGVVQIPAGRFLDGSGTTRPLLAGTVVHALFAVALDLVPTFEAVLALRFVWGLVGGFLVVAGATHVARLYSGGTATRMQGLYGGALTLGGAAAFVAVPAVTARTGWFGVHALGTVLAVPAVVALTSSVRGPSSGRLAPRPVTNGDSAVPLRTLFREPSVALAAICYVTILSSYITLSTFVTAYFEDIGILASLNATVLALAGVARAGGGIGAERWEVDDARAIAVAATGGAVGFLGLTVAGHPVLVATLPMATMVAVSAPFGAVYNVAADADAGEGGALGVVLAVGNLAALVFPAVTGAVREVTGGYGAAFLLLAAANGAAVGAALALRRV